MGMAKYGKKMSGKKIGKNGSLVARSVAGNVTQLSVAPSGFGRFLYVIENPQMDSMNNPVGP